MLSECEINIDRNDKYKFRIDWKENDGKSEDYINALPEYREILLYVDSSELLRFNISEFSPQTEQGWLVEVSSDAQIKPYQLWHFDDDWEIAEPGATTCDIKTPAPTRHPTRLTTRSPSKSPTKSPSSSPSAQPTLSPTYRIEIENCSVLLGQFNDKAEIKTFDVNWTVPTFDPPITPDKSDVRFQVVWGAKLKNSSDPLNADKTESYTIFSNEYAEGSNAVTVINDEITIIDIEIIGDEKPV